MLKLTDLRKTTRRSKGDDLRTVHPRLLRDRALAPRIDMAVAYLEGMLGRPRRDLDAEVVVQLFGDHKVAQCIVAALAATYRHRARTFVEVLDAPTVAALAVHGITTASELRLWIYRRVNATSAGFVGGAERAPFLGQAGALLGLTTDQIETLITLDTPANAVLTRSGPLPTAADVIASYNFAVVGALLANAPLVRLSLSRAPADADDIRALCAQAGVAASLAGRELVLHGRQDTLNGWSRHGARVVRLLATLLACGLPVRAGEAMVAAPTGDEWRFRLDAETLGFLGASPADQPAGWRYADLLATGRSADAIATGYAGLRRAGAADGWLLRRAVEPLVVDGAVVPVCFTCLRGTQRVWLVPQPSGPAGSATAARVATRFPLVHVDASAASEVPVEAGVFEGSGTPRLIYAGHASVAALPALLAHAIGSAEQRADVARVEAVCDEVRRIGVLTEPRLARRLGCAEEQVAVRLTLPSARQARQQHHLEYVEGFGLCRADVLTRAQAAAADVTHMRDNAEVGPAWILRTLGRRLREVTGASEGIECLIAYLGAA